MDYREAVRQADRERYRRGSRTCPTCEPYRHYWWRHNVFLLLEGFLWGGP